MARPAISKPIHCRKCGRFLFSTALLYGDAGCPTCLVRTSIKEQRRVSKTAGNAGMGNGSTGPLSRQGRLGVPSTAKP